MQSLLNLTMEVEREQYLRAGRYQRTAERLDYANGGKPRTLQTRQGELTLSIPWTRRSDFYPSCRERGLRSERAIRPAMAEMYIPGAATRKVRGILDKTRGLEVTAMQASRAAEAAPHKYGGISKQGVEKKRTRCIRAFANREALLRVAAALPVELDDAWMTKSRI